MNEETKDAYTAYIAGYDAASGDDGNNPYDFVTHYTEWKLFERGFQARYIELYGKKA